MIEIAHIEWHQCEAEGGYCTACEEQIWGLWVWRMHSVSVSGELDMEVVLCEACYFFLKKMDAE